MIENALNNNIWLILDDKQNIIKIEYDWFIKKWQIDMILEITEEELKDIKNQNLNFNTTFNKLSQKYKNEILNKLNSKKNGEELQNKTEKLITNFFNRFSEILSKNDIPWSLNTSKS